MACLDASGAPTAVATRLLQSLGDGCAHSVAEVARATELPLYRVRAGLRELAAAEIVVTAGADRFRVADRGRVLLAG